MNLDQNFWKQLREMILEELSEYNRTQRVDVEGCARCGENHKNITFYKFRNPIEDSDGTIWSYWALCPQLQEPILLKVVEK